MIRKLSYLLILCLALFSCETKDPTPVDPPIDREAFAKGADISWATKMQSEGFKFYNTNNEQRECTALMKELGMNSVRYRVWVNPTDGWNNKADVLAKAKIAQNERMRIMIDFHYSDTWADPGHQNPPQAWLSYNLTQLKQAVADHTADVLNTLKNNGIEVEWVQVGNETRNGMLYPLGEVNYSNSNFAQLVTVGYDAVKSVYPEAKVIVHVDEGNNFSRYKWIFDYLDQKGGKYDMIGMSIYPDYNNWRPKAEDCIATINKVGERYNKPVMICETGLSYYIPQQCQDMLNYLITNARDSTNGVCKGLFYWEPQAPPHYNNGYDKGAFVNNKPTIALDAFKN